MDYAWATAEKDVLVAYDDHGGQMFIPAVDGNPEYDAFLAAGGVAKDYDPPPAAPAVELTPAEKLAAAGLTVEDLKALLA
jgi:hypothetical protein